MIIDCLVPVPDSWTHWVSIEVYGLFICVRQQERTESHDVHVNTVWHGTLNREDIPALREALARWKRGDVLEIVFRVNDLYKRDYLTGDHTELEGKGATVTERVTYAATRDTFATALQAMEAYRSR